MNKLVLQDFTCEYNPWFSVLIFLLQIGWHNTVFPRHFQQISTKSKFAGICLLALEVRTKQSLTNTTN